MRTHGEDIVLWSEDTREDIVLWSEDTRKDTVLSGKIYVT